MQPGEEAAVEGVPVEAAESAQSESVETIQREMTVFARRARASAGRLHPELSLVSYTLLGHLEESGGCRATDLAAHHALDKSTVSRQVAALERTGLIERRQDPEDHRVQLLHLTGAGRRILAQVTESRREAFRERLAQWPEADLERFARYLVRYNEWQGPTPMSTHPTPPTP
ncbi:MarR family winged helix-turn-helix transcriptional regulator [Streptomyces asoensis]|uniref:MarR family winged helix-turn-helix transcriptional regulator n=1 Tax=Streptomyces asoensis TaxID=249586 RepID=UPI003F4D46C9